MGRLFQILFVHFFAVAAWGQSVPFYRTLKASFPSGNSLPEKLQRTTSEISVEHWVHAMKDDGVEGWARRQDVFSEMNFANRAILASGAGLRRKPEWNSNPDRQSGPNQTARVLQLDIPWAQIEQSGIKRWVEIRHLQPDPTDLGFFIARSTIALYRRPQLKSTVLGYLPSGTHIQPLKLAGSWAGVRLGRQLGFIQLKDVVSRFDFATEVQDTQGNWSRVSKVEEGHLLLTSGKQFLFSEAKALRGDPFRLLNGSRPTSLSDHPSRHARLKGEMSPFTSFLRIGENALRWGRSHLREHGWVWWPMDIRQVKSDGREELPAQPVDRLLQPDRELVESSQLFKRKVFDVVTSPLFPRMSFASAGGIYRTLDGEVWERLKEFRENNLPLAIADNGTVFIGPYLSKNQGESFSPFIPWEKILNGVTKMTGKYPLRLSLLEVRPEDHDGQKLKIRIDPGFGAPLTLKTTDQGKTWYMAQPRKRSP